MLSIRRIAALVLLVFAGACAKPLTKPIAISTGAAGAVTRTVHARVTMTISGADTVAFTKDTQLQIVEIIGHVHGKDIPTITWFLSVSAGEEIQLQDGRYFLYDADLAPGIYRGPGTYKITALPQNNPAGVPNPFQGGATYVQFIEKQGLVRYDRVAQPCTLIVSKQQRTGNVDCPRLEDKGGQSVRVRWSWELT